MFEECVEVLFKQSGEGCYEYIRHIIYYVLGINAFQGCTLYAIRVYLNPCIVSLKYRDWGIK